MWGKLRRVLCNNYCCDVMSRDSHVRVVMGMISRARCVALEIMSRDVWVAMGIISRACLIMISM